MGNKASQEDETPLLNDDEVSLSLQIQPVFEELNLVLIGSHGVGKNNIGNAILKEKVFTIWKSFRYEHIDVTRKVSGRQIRLSRTTGWSGDLKSNKSKRSIVHCVQSLYATGPHAILLALKVNSALSEMTIRTLESLLTPQLWEHTIVLFTDGEKLGRYQIEDYIRVQQLQPFINKCGKRYITITKKNNDQIIETIEELIARKNASSFFKISEQDEVDEKTLLSDWSKIVERIKSRIHNLSNYKKTLMVKLKRNAKSEDRISRLIKSKDAEIERLENIVRQKEREIENLRSSIQPNLFVLQRRIYELEQQLSKKKKEIEKKDAKIEELTKELQKCREKASKLRTHELDVAAKSDHIELQVFPSNGSALRNWSVTLLQILEMLSDDELKKMKYHLLNGGYEINRSSIEHKDRVDLADQILKQWDAPRSVQIMRDVLKKIPHNDDRMIELFTPYLKAIGETW